MCLTITAEIPEVDEAGLRTIIREWPESGLTFHTYGKGLLGRRQPQLALHGCDLLSDSADWNAPTWSMRPESILELTELFLRLFDRVPGELVISALWEGNRSETDQSVTRAEFVDVVRHGAIGTKTRYVVQN